MRRERRRGRMRRRRRERRRGEGMRGRRRRRERRRRRRRRRRGREEGGRGGGGGGGRGWQLYQYIQAMLKFIAPSHVPAHSSHIHTPLTFLPFPLTPLPPHCDMSGAQEILNVLVLLPHLHFQPPPLCSLEITLTRDSVHLLLQLQDFIL